MAPDVIAHAGTLLGQLCGLSPAGWECAEAGGVFRIETSLRYLDGGVLEVFVEPRDGAFVVTDYGEAFRFLETHGLDPLGATFTDQRAAAVVRATHLAGATLTEGVLQVSVAQLVEVPAAVARLAQAMTRVADLADVAT